MKKHIYDRCRFLSLNERNVKYVMHISRIESDSFDTPWSYKEIKKEFFNPHSFSFALLKGNDIIGYIFSVCCNDEIQITKICITKKQRNRGNAQLLLKKYLNTARYKNVSKIFLEVNINNETALWIYKKLGFKCNRTRKNFYSTGDDALEMMLDIDNEECSFSSKRNHL